MNIEKHGGSLGDSRILLGLALKYGPLFAVASFALATPAIVHRGWQLLMLWPAVSLGVVAAGYLSIGPRVFGKSERGTLTPISQLLLLPYLLTLWTLWHVLRLVRSAPAVSQLTENIWIGRRLLSHELPDEITHVVDLTCEFNEPAELRQRSYFSFPILDGASATPDQLRIWAKTVADLPGNVFIHCAEGHGRTGLFAAAVLLYRGDATSPEEALSSVQSKRARVRLGREQLAVLREAYSTP
mgnify:CR=1 FL=1